MALIAVLTGCGGSTAGEDRPEEDATLMLDFQPNAVHAGIYTAVERGYDSAEGVNLTVRVPGASTDAVKLLLSGQVEFAVLDIHDLALARERGKDLVGVYALVERPLAAVLAQPGVSSPRALEGRRAGVTGLPSDRAVLSSVVAGSGGDPKKVHPVTIGFNAVPALLSRKVDAATAFWDVEGVALQRRRPGIREFRVDDFGAPAYPELVVCVTRETLDDRRPVVRALVRALVRGYQQTKTDPEGSLSDLEQRNPGLDRSLLDAESDAVGPAIPDGDGRLGTLDPVLLRAWGRWERRFGIVTRPVDVDAAFDPRLADAANQDLKDPGGG